MAMVDINPNVKDKIKIAILLVYVYLTPKA
jgi:hypothetical protein